MSIAITIPIRTTSEANAHEQWRARQRRAKVQRHAAWAVVTSTLRHLIGGPFAPVPGIVTITRIASRRLDSDNLAGSQKHVRDGVADALGIDDRDPRVEWRYAQEKGKPREYAVRITIEEAP